MRKATKSKVLIALFQGENGQERLISTKKVVVGWEECRRTKQRRAHPIKKPTKLNGSGKKLGEETQKDGISLS